MKDVWFSPLKSAITDHKYYYNYAMKYDVRITVVSAVWGFICNESHGRFKAKVILIFTDSLFLFTFYEQLNQCRNNSKGIKNLLQW